MALKNNTIHKKKENRFIIKNKVIFILIFCMFPLNLNEINCEGVIEGIAKMDCTIFTVKDDNNVFFGSNEDSGSNRKYAEIWFTNSDNNLTYGCALLGYKDNEPGGNELDEIPIGGINSEGLCFDANGIPPGNVKSNFSLGSSKSDIRHWETILKECGSVSEVINWYQTHNMGGLWGNQIHWADRTGSAVVISPHSNQSIAFTMIKNQYLVSTNFNLADPNKGGYPCERHSKVSSDLQLITQVENLTRQEIIPILNAVHFEQTEEYTGTIYSNIFDLKNQLIYLYSYGNYDQEIILDLHEELAKGDHSYKIPSLLQTAKAKWGLIIGIPIATVCVGLYIFQRLKKRSASTISYKKNL